MINDFENFVVQDYTYASRFIASWLREGGNLRRGGDYKLFREWLVSIGVTPENAKRISFLAENGKLELEEMAKRFLKKHEDQ